MSIAHDLNHNLSSGARETLVIEYYKHPAPLGAQVRKC